MSIKAVSEVSHTRLRRRARYGDLFAPVLLAGWVLVGVTLAGALGGWHWWLDYFANFPVQCLGLMLPVLGLSLWRRAWRHAAVFGAVVAWNGVLVWPLVFGGVWVPPSLVHKLADNTDLI